MRINGPCANYLRDVLPTLLEAAREAKADSVAKRTQLGEGAAQFESGRALAYYEVCSMLVAQLDAFGIDRTALGIPDGLDVDGLLS